MNAEIKFESDISRRIWINYIKQVNRIIKPLTSAQRSEILLELQSHIFEAMSQDCDNDEESKILNVIEKLGDPVLYLEPMVKDKLLYNTLKSLNPLGIIYLILNNVMSGFRRFLYSILLGLGYMISAILFISGALKIFIHEVGFYYLGPPWYRFVIGTVKDTNDPWVKDVFGFWWIPFGIGTSVILYYILTKLLNKLNK